MKTKPAFQSISNVADLHFRTLYGKLFASLLTHFGSSNIDAIEDVIQSAFYKALKSWKPNLVPSYPERWLYTVARNELIDQINARQKRQIESLSNWTIGNSSDTDDLEDGRLKTLVLCTNLVKLKKINAIGQHVFILKNICGLSIAEISSSLSMVTDAVYKRHQRTKKILQEYAPQKLRKHFTQSSTANISAIEAIIYALFNAGYDSLRKKDREPVNDEVCLAALSLAKLLAEKHSKNSTNNLIALFCFHLARVPARFEQGKLISFFKQDRSMWHSGLLQQGFHYLTKPESLNRFHLEALITSKHMITDAFDMAHWQSILSCYDLLLTIVDSPIISMNRAYVLKKLERTEEALQILEDIQDSIPANNFYYSLLMGEVLSSMHPSKARVWYEQAVEASTQSFRTQHIKGIIDKT